MFQQLAKETLLNIHLRLFSEQMALVAHLVGIDQLGYEKELGMTPCVSIFGISSSSSLSLLLE